MPVRLPRTLLLSLTLALVVTGLLGAPLWASIARQAANARPPIVAPDATWVDLIEIARLRDEVRSGAFVVRRAMHLCGLDEIGWDGNEDDCDANSRHVLTPNPGSSISLVLRHRLVEFSMRPRDLPLGVKNSTARIVPGHARISDHDRPNFARRFPGAIGVLMYSQAALSGDGRTAVMYEQFVCGTGCVAGTLYEFARGDESWAVTRAEWLWGVGTRAGAARPGSAQLVH